MEKQLTFGELIHIFWKKLYLIIILTVIGGTAGFAWSRISYHPVYTASTSFIVFHKNSKKIESDLKAIPTYESILTNRSTLRSVQKKMNKVSGYKGSVSTLSSGITTVTSPNSLIIKVSADAPSAKIAVAMANNSVTVFKTRINHVINAGTVRQLAKADTSNVTKTPTNSKKQLLMGAMIGFAVGILLVLFLERKVLFM
jgi:capsular polysaccharide biosynthesis protein